MSLGSGRAEAWLEEFERSLRGPSSRRRDRRDELEAHVDERVRDLLLEGAAEDRAERAVLDELGSPAALAESLARVDRAHRRSIVMHGMVLTVASAALVTSVVSLTPGTARVGDIAPELGVAQDEVALHELLDSPITLEEAVTWEELFDRIQRAAGGSMVEWTHFDTLGFEREEPVYLETSEVRLGLVLELLNRRFEGDAVVLVPSEHGVEITSQSVLDRRSVRLTAYPLGSILAMGVHPDEVTELIAGFVAPGSWQEQGGELARMSIVGDRLFIEAPARFDERIGWILDQLGGEDGEGGDEVGMAGGGARAFGGL